MSSDRKTEIKILLRNTYEVKQIYDYVDTQIKNGQWMSIRHYYDPTLLQNYVKNAEFASIYRDDHPLIYREKRNTPVIIISKSPT